MSTLSMGTMDSLPTIVGLAMKLALLPCVSTMKEPAASVEKV